MESFPTTIYFRRIAAENNLSETAFLVKEDKVYRLRWFTPTIEVPLCGHATLASAAVVMQRLEPDRGVVVFHLGRRIIHPQISPFTQICSEGTVALAR